MDPRWPSEPERDVFNIGPMELMVILVIALLVVGPKRLPDVGRSVGRALREFRRAQDEVTRSIRTGLDDIDEDARGSGQDAENTGEGSSEGDPDGATAATDPTGDAVRTLGRSLAELRRAREELQRSFRVDLGDLTRPSPRRPAAPRAQAAPDVSSPGPGETPPPSEQSQTDEAAGTQG